LNFRETIISEMKGVFGDDVCRIGHAMAVLGYAERINAAECADGDVVTASAILHDIGIQEAERKYGSASGKYQEIEGPGIAKEILGRYEVGDVFVDHVCKIIANHHSGRDIDTLEFRVIWDADWLVNIADEFGGADMERLERLVNKVFKTETGLRLATEKYLTD
jgi:hypothetical protein